MLGVIALNYHAILNDEDAFAPIAPSFFERLFNPVSGVLSTRFAATFVVVAGIGVALLSSRTSDFDPAGVRLLRQRLLRRGAFLLVVGFILEWIWPGTILFYYGAYFLLATVLFRLATRWLIVIGIGAGLIATAVGTWSAWMYDRRELVTWLGFDRIDSIQDLAVRTFLDYTHPVFPWIAFLCTGMIIGRHLSTLSVWRWKVAAIATSTVVAIYAIVTLLDTMESLDGAVVDTLVSMETFDRGLLYLMSTLGIALIAFLAISFVVEKCPIASIMVHLQRAGQLSLSLYLLHVLAYSLAVNWFGWIGGESLSTALLFAGGFWVVAISVASWWHHRIGRGPAEIVYRTFGG